MPSFKQTLKYGLLRYPTLFPNPVNVCEHLFCTVGTGYDWIDGELVDNFDPNKTNESLVMKYPDETENREDLAELEKLIPDFYAERKLKATARRIQMKFVQDNIETILIGSPVAVYFGNNLRGYYFLKGISIKHAHAFNFPENIKEDWAKGLYKFLEYWLVQLNTEYGVSHQTHDVSFWPADIQQARTTIIETRNRLHPYAHGGQTYDQYISVMREALNRIKSKENE